MSQKNQKTIALSPSPATRRLVLLLGLGFLSLLAGRGLIQAVRTDKAVPADALGFLKHQKGDAEQYASWLRTIEKTRPSVYARGRTLYVDAKGYFDELIEQLKVGLITGENPQYSPKFAALEQEAATKQVEFAKFVKREVADKSKGARSGLPDVFNAPALLNGLTDAVVKIWMVYRDNDKEQRDWILNELAHLEWLPIDKL